MKKRSIIAGRLLSKKLIKGLGAGWRTDKRVPRRALKVEFPGFLV